MPTGKLPPLPPNYVPPKNTSGTANINQAPQSAPPQNQTQANTQQQAQTTDTAPKLPDNVKISQNQAEQLARQISANAKNALPDADIKVELKPLPQNLKTQIIKTLLPPSQTQLAKNAVFPSGNPLPAPPASQLNGAKGLIDFLKTFIKPSLSQNLPLNNITAGQGAGQTGTAQGPDIKFSIFGGGETPNAGILRAGQSLSIQGSGGKIPLLSQFIKQQSIDISGTSLNNAGRPVLPHFHTPLLANIERFDHAAPRITGDTKASAGHTAGKTPSENLRTELRASLSQTGGLLQSGAQAGQLSARLEGFAPGLIPVISFPDFAASDLNLYTLQAGDDQTTKSLAAKLPQGTELKISMLSNTQNTAGGAATQITLSGLPVIPLGGDFSQFTGSWPLMDDISQSVQQSVSTAAAQALHAASPSPAQPAQFGAAALFFMAAVRGGDLQSWIGDKALEGLKSAGKGGLLAQLGREAGNLMQMAREAPGGQEWRAAQLPLYYEGQIDKIALHYREEYDNSDNDEISGSKFTRFLFDLSLDRLGPVQLDGVHRQNRLDIILRTEQSFSAAARQAMRQIYTGALEQSNMSGELSFQYHPDQWVHIYANQNAEKTQLDA